MAKYHINLTAIFVERHRIVGQMQRKRPAGRLATLGEIDRGDFMRDGHVYKDLPAVERELKAFRMSFELDIGNLLAAHRIDDREGSFTVTDNNSMRIRINSYIVGIIAEFNSTRRLQIGPLEEMNRSVAAIGNVQRVGR